MTSDERPHKCCEASGEKRRDFIKGNHKYYTLSSIKFQPPILSSLFGKLINLLFQQAEIMDDCSIPERSSPPSGNAGAKPAYTH